MAQCNNPQDIYSLYGVYNCISFLSIDDSKYTILNC